jgi:hypothetical protein
MLALASSTAGRSVLPRPAESLPGYYRSVGRDGWAAVFLLPDAGEERLTLPLAGHLVYVKNKLAVIPIMHLDRGFKSRERGQGNYFVSGCTLSLD